MKTLHTDCADQLSFGKARAQRGVVLLTAMIALVIISLAALSLVRSVDTKSVIAGNLAFKQSAALAAEMGVEQAIVWLSANKLNLDASSPGNGYYALRYPGGSPCDLTGNATPADTTDNVGWAGSSAGSACGMNAAPVTMTLPAGYQAWMVVNRMCAAAGSADDACEPFKGADSGTKRSGAHKSAPKKQYHYRVIVRVDGPRNTASFAQTVIILPSY